MPGYREADEMYFCLFVIEAVASGSNAFFPATLLTAILFGDVFNCLH